MRRFSVYFASLAIFALAMTFWFGGCAKSPTNPNGGDGGELNKAATPLSSPSPSPSPTSSPSPFPSPSPSPSPTESPSPSPNPDNVAFEVFFIEKARVELDRDPGDQRFEVEGSFILGSASNGVDILRETVTIVFDGFNASIPAGSFVRDDDNEGFEFEDRASGIEKIEVRDDGRFEVEGRDLNLMSLDLNYPVRFSLQIGNDSGKVEITFDGDGRFENPNPFPNPSPSPTASPSPEPSPTVSPSPLPSPTASPSPAPSPTVSPSPEPSPTVSPSPLPSPTASPSPAPSPTVSPSPEPSPTVSPSPAPSPTASPSPAPSPTVSPSPAPSPTVSPSPEPSPTVSPSPVPSPTASPSPAPSPTVSPNPSPSPELLLRGLIQALVVRGPNDGDVTVEGVKFVVTGSTELEDEDGNSIALSAFAVGEEVDAWGPPAVNNTTQATRIRKQ